MDISHLPIVKIKELAEDSTLLAGAEFMSALEQDPRVGVQAIYRRLKKASDSAKAEAERMARLYFYENGLKARGYYPVAGVDEAGRGPLAGPVAAAAVILPDECALPGLNDSKKLTPQKRELLAAQIKEQAVAWSVALADVEEIYRHNIHQASQIAMCRAVTQLKLKPAGVLVDGFRIGRLSIPQKPIIGGDALSASIAAASILAKVERDCLMEEYHEMYPVYGFQRHKGYGTAEHLQALTRWGPCPIHRTGFRPVLEILARTKKNDTAGEDR